MKVPIQRTRKKPPAIPAATGSSQVQNWRRSKQSIVLHVNDELPLSVDDDRSVHLLAQLVERLENIAAISAGLKDLDEAEPSVLKSSRPRREPNIAC